MCAHTEPEDVNNCQERQFKKPFYLLCSDCGDKDSAVYVTFQRVEGRGGEGREFTLQVYVQTEYKVISSIGGGGGGLFHGGAIVTIVL